MNRKKNGKKRIRARALDPYKRVNVCVPLDVYNHFARHCLDGEAVGGYIRGVLTRIACDSWLDEEQKMRVTMRNGAGVLPMQGKKQGKKDSKPTKKANLVKME